MKKDLKYYLSLDYPVTLHYDKDEGYYAEIALLDHCSGVGDTLDEVFESVMLSKELWIETALEDGIPIPEPEPEKEYSGRILLRVPKSLHAKLMRAAENDNTSLNQYLVMLISSSLESVTLKNTVENIADKMVSVCSVLTRIKRITQQLVPREAYIGTESPGFNYPSSSRGGKVVV